MSRRLEKLIEQKAWETLTDYGYNDAHLLEQLTESVLERLANLDETMIPREPKSLPPFPNPKFYEPPFTQPSSPFSIPGDPGYYDPDSSDEQRRNPKFDPADPYSPFYDPNYDPSQPQPGDPDYRGDPPPLPPEPEAPEGDPADRNGDGRVTDDERRLYDLERESERRRIRNLPGR